MILTSPPYFAKEEYSEDSEQSYLHFSNYKDWLGNSEIDKSKLGDASIRELTITTKFRIFKPGKIKWTEKKFTRT